MRVLDCSGASVILAFSDAGQLCRRFGAGGDLNSWQWQWVCLRFEVTPCMTSRRVTIKLASVALAAGLILIVLLLPAPREPVHQGKPLTEWLGGFDHNYESTNYSASRAAIRAMGTNALPFLIRYLRAKDPPYYAQ